MKLELSKNYDYADMWSATSLLPRYQFEIFYQWIDFSLCPQSTFDNPEWFYRHVDMHGQCTDKEILPNKSEVISCCWKGNLKIQMDKASSKSDILILLFLWTLLYASLWPCAIWNNCLVFNLEGQPCYCSQDQVDTSTSASPSRIIEAATAAVDWCRLLLRDIAEFQVHMLWAFAVIWRPTLPQLSHSVRNLPFLCSLEQVILG